MIAKVEISVGQSYQELLEAAAELTMRTPGFSFSHFQPVCEIHITCAKRKRESVLRLYICGEILASDN